MALQKFIFLPGVVLSAWLGVLALDDSRTEAADLDSAWRTDSRTQRLAQSYDEWRRARHGASGSYQIELGLGWFKGVSEERSSARGRVSIDLSTGAVEVEVQGIGSEALGDVWLVDNRPGAGASALPGPGDAMLLVGALDRVADRGSLATVIHPDAFVELDVDLVVVTRSGERPGDGGVLYGTLPLYERLYRVSWRVERGLRPVAGVESSLLGPLADFPARSASAAGSEGALRAFFEILAQGDATFENETFAGNGRTCATCHPAENNFTLDKDFIATLDPADPLFVAEFNDDLNHDLNGGLFFENPVLMRELALIVVNDEGFDDLTRGFVMRSVNHLFALDRSMEPAPTGCFPAGVVHRLGWDGDGSPGSGSLREFAIAAVIQHFPLTLGRVEGADFRLPTDEELDALEALQLTLGRRSEPRLDVITFHDPDVATGRDLFFAFDGGRCNVCHDSGGAIRRVPSGGMNFNFDIGTVLVPHPAEALGERLPRDDGYDSESPSRSCENSFSTPSIIEAADTPPFGHNNVFATLEETVAHYSTPEFNDLSDAGRSIQGDIDLTEQEIQQIGALLRALNALQNIDQVLDCVKQVLNGGSLGKSRRALPLCMVDNQDAIDVLMGGPLDLHPTARTHLQTSLDLHQAAIDATTLEERDVALLAAEVELNAAIDDIAILPCQ